MKVSNKNLEKIFKQLFKLKNKDLNLKNINILKNLDSIETINVISKIEKKFKKKIDFEKFLKIKNIKDFMKIVNK